MRSQISFTVKFGQGLNCLQNEAFIIVINLFQYIFLLISGWNQNEGKTVQVRSGFIFDRLDLETELFVTNTQLFGFKWSEETVIFRLKIRVSFFDIGLWIILKSTGLKLKLMNENDVVKSYTFQKGFNFVRILFADGNVDVVSSVEVEFKVVF